MIYFINDLLCEEVFYVGHTENIKKRWGNHKSHIKTCKNTCELANHFTKLANSIHKLDKSSNEIFTSELKNHLAITFIERVETFPESREKFWQHTLKASPLFGGIIKRTLKFLK